MGRDSNDVPVGGHGAADISPILDQGTDQQLDGDTSSVGVAKTELENEISHSMSCHPGEHVSLLRVHSIRT